MDVVEKQKEEVACFIEKYQDLFPSSPDELGYAAKVSIKLIPVMQDL